MPTLDNHQSSDFTKLIYIGDSGTGKTGSLTSLLAAGYSFRILDMDNGLDSLVYYAKKAGADLSRVEYSTFQDRYKASKSGPKPTGDRAFVKALEQIEEWSEIEDPKCIFVLDTLSSFGKAAYEWANGLNPTAKDKRQIYFAAQQAVESVVAMLAGDGFKMNVILISHVNYKEVMEGVNKGYVNAIGTALGPTIAKYFNTMILAETSGAKLQTKRKIKTLPTGVIDLKMPNEDVGHELPLESGMAEIFAQLRGEKKQ